MGSWFATCMLSKLPIVSGNKCRLIVLREGDTNSVFPSYANDLWIPIGLPIKGKYDDYGSIEIIDKCLINEEYISSSSIEEFLEKIANSRYEPCTIKNALGQSKKLSTAIILDSVYEELLKIELTDNWEMSYRYNPMSLKILKEQKKEFINHLENNSNNRVRINNTHGNKNYLISDLAFDQVLCNKIYHLMEYPNWQESKYLDDVIEFIFFNILMNTGRQSYFPPSGNGSQNWNTPVQKVIASCISSFKDEHYDEE